MSSVFPYRRTRIIFHSGGITQRQREIPDSWLVNFDFTEVNDYDHSASNDLSPPSRGNKTILRLVRGPIKRLGFLADLNHEVDFERLKITLLEVRGHYSGIALTVSEVHHIRDLIFEHFFEQPSSSCMSIHYRLGDLMEIGSKTYIHPTRLALAISIFDNVDEIMIYSDSTKAPPIYQLGSRLDGYTLNLVSIGPIETIANCFQCQIFVGTNSKISLWVALLRLLTGHSGYTLLPLELRTTLARLMHRNINEEARLRFY